MGGPLQSVPKIRLIQQPARRILRATGVALPLVVLSACGGGGDGFSGSGGNTPPTANAGADSTVFEGTSVNLAGVGSDADGDTLSFTWTQTAGQAVTINNASQAASNFIAPNVAAGAPETLTFQLRVSDGTDSRTDSVSVTIEENESPIANAGPDRSVIQSTQVTIDGSASSDPNTIDTLTYAWTQVGGPAVPLSGSATAQPTFTAPSVGAGNVVLDFQLQVSDGVNNDVDTVSITVEAGQSQVAISGTLSYEFVEAFPNCSQLDFDNIVTRPIRRASVQLIDATNSNIIASTTASDAGAYAFSNIPALTDVRLRVRAELKQQGSPNWDVEVRDNVDIDAPIPALEDRPLYVVEFSNFSTGGADIANNDYTATTGWGGASYTGARAAAPFAILDAIYSAMQLILSVDPNASFAPLDVFWSVNNTRTSSDIDIDAGELSGAFYTSNPDGGAANPSLFLTGDVNVDTSEFDDDVTVHEWGHYFEDTFSRTDSIGGPHALGETIDARLAWGEGWATAFAAMALGNVESCNTFAVGSPGGFGIDVESGGFGVQGWYNEISVATFLYDLFDTNDDGPDDNSIGFQPIFDTMVGPQVSTEAFTTVFSFATELRTMLNAGQQAFLDAQLTRENINPAGLDIWGSTETNDVNGSIDVLPIYTDLTANGSTVNICANSQFEFLVGNPPVPERTGNKLGEDRYVRLSVPVTDTYNVVVATTTPLPADDPMDEQDQSDPDIYIFRDGQLVDFGLSGVANLESFTTSNQLLAGEVYSVYVDEFRFEDSGSPDDFPQQICFDVSFTATP